MSRLKNVLMLLFVAALTLPIVAFAQGNLLPENPGLPGGRNNNIAELMMDIIRNILLPMAGLVAVFFIIVGGFQIMLSGTNADLAKRGKETLKNAILGLIVVILSYVMVSVTVNTLF